MKKSYVISKLLNGVNFAFEKEGFKLNKRNNNFIRKTNDYVHIVDLFFFKKGLSVEIEPAIRIKIKAIEDIYKSISSIDGRPYCTLGNHFFDILRYMDEGVEKGVRKVALSNWIVNKESDIYKLIQAIPEYLVETMVPYFNDNSTIAKVDELLNKYPRELSTHNYLYPLRANIAIIAAKLNNNPRYDEFLKTYEEELEDAQEIYKKEFIMIRKKLKDNADYPQSLQLPQE